MTTEDDGAPPPTPAADPTEANSNVDNESKDSAEKYFIYHQTEEAENSFYKCLVEGFQSLRESRENKKKPLFSLDPAEAPKPVDSAFKRISNHATVNVIDPTTNQVNSSSSKEGNSSTNHKLNFGIENVYEKLSYIFERDYGSTLRSVQYKSMRSGENEFISNLPVQTVLARAGGGSVNGDANAPWGGNVAAPVSDPSEWHNGPFCHIYIAACESLEQYRNKVRPAVQAFVSQIESLAKTSGTTQDQGGSAQYLIVYVPTGPKDAASVPPPPENDMTPGPVRMGLAGRIQKARQRITNYNADLNESQHSKDSLDSDEVLSDNEDPESATTVALNLLSKNERTIYKKIAGDFPNGKVCVMSISSLDKSADESVSSNGMAVRTQEWNAFNRMLGTVIANGFKDRCRRYNDELRKLDTQRMFATTGLSQKSELKNSKNRNPPPAFNPAYFFLVKESLAFTYEQMQLPTEALLQYDEFMAFLPDTSEKEDKKVKRARRKSQALADTSSPSLVELADAGDYTAFRRKIRSEIDLAPVADIMRRYLFARELCLLFKMETPRELVSRCHAFAKSMYTTMMRDLPDLSEEDQRRRKVEAAKWFVQFSWDVKSASQHFFSAIDISQPTPDNQSIETGSDIISDISDTSQTDHIMASQLSELLEVARLFLKELGNTELIESNPIRTFEKKLPEDLFKPWEPWTPAEATKEPSGGEARASMVKFDGPKSAERVFLLKNAFDSTDTYEAAYREILAAIVTLSRFADRRRFAARLQAEIAESYIRKGDLKGAANILKSIVKMCRTDQWDRCHFWRLFRLAYCQRSTATPTDYLKTLVTCFTPKLAAVAPTLALEALQEDLDVVMGHPEVGQSRYGKLVCLETELKILETTSDESTMGTGVDQKQMIKRFCSVGENVRVLLSIKSHLPRSIFLESLKVFIVSFTAFSKIIESQESVEEEDAFHTLSMEAPIELAPGKNTFTFDWKPTCAGQFVLSTVEVVWKEGFFYYDSMELPAPLLGIDILPSEPAHSLSLDPGYLVPGQDQRIRITFDAGSDLVTAGKIQLECAEGISIIPPGVDPDSGQWESVCEVELDSVKPGESTVFTAHVRCGLIEKFSRESVTQNQSFDAAHGLSVKAFTTYLHAGSESSQSNYSTVPSMKTVLEAFAPILEKTALSVESVDVLWITKGEKAMLNIWLMSNTPHHFFVEEWKLMLPPPLTIAEGGDFSSDFMNCRVSDGDELSLAFECIISDEKPSEGAGGAVLHVKLRDDEGKIYPFDLALDMSEFYLQLIKSDIPKPLHLTASLELEVNEGVINEPVVMTYTIELTGLGDMGSNDDFKLLYSVVWQQSDWLVAGKVNGTLDIFDSSPSFAVVGVPAKSGILKRFPSIDLRFVSDEKSTPIKLLLRHPKSFRSLSRVSETGVAYPSSKVSV